MKARAPVTPRTPARTSFTNLTQPVATIEGDVLLERTVDPTKINMGDRPVRKVESKYLDGRVVREVVDAKKRGTYAVTTDRVTAVSTRTNNIADFGRLDAAAVSLLEVMSRFDQENPPSPEQLEKLVSSYQNLLGWEQDIREKIARAGASIDLVKVRLSQLL